MNFERLYEYRFRDVDQAQRADVWKELAPYLHEQLGRPDVVLDPAAGRGEFIDAVPAEERWAVDQQEPDERHRDPGVRWQRSDVLRADLPDGHFDGVLVSNFLEHLTGPDQIAEVLARLHRATRPGGRIAVMGPNFRYCADEYFDMADHVVPLTHRAVAEHLFATGFEPERVVPRFLPYSITGRLPATRRLVRTYLRVPLAWRIIGRQFLVVGRRI